MSQSALLDRPRSHPIDRPARAAVPEGAPAWPDLLRPEETIVVYGDFACPWSYLAQRRASALAGAGARVDWRAVGQATAPAGVPDDKAARYAAMTDQARLAASLLSTGEELPLNPAGFVPRTRATISAYAETYAAGVAPRGLDLLFTSYWRDGVDIGDPNVLRVLLHDELRSSASPSPQVSEWGIATDLAGAPLSSAAWHLVRSWNAEWRDLGSPVLPVIQVGEHRPVFGVRAVEWLGRAVQTLGLDVRVPEAEPEIDPAGLPTLSWISGFGGAWLERSQRAAGRDDVT